MAKTERIAKISFSYDRQWEQKLSQVYHLLVPGQPGTIFTEYSIDNNPIEDQVYENSSYIHAGVLGWTKGE